MTRAHGAAALLAFALLAPVAAAAEPKERGLQVRAGFWGEWIPSPWAPPSLRAGPLGLAGTSVHVAWRFPAGFELTFAGVRTAAVVAGDYATVDPSQSFALSRVPSGTLGGEVAGAGFFLRRPAWSLTVRLAPGFLALLVKGRTGDGQVTSAGSPVFFTLRGEVEGCALAGAVRFCAFLSPMIAQMDQAGNGLSAGLTVGFGP